jgi:hypothetical protein
VAKSEINRMLIAGGQVQPETAAQWAATRNPDSPFLQQQQDPVASAQLLELPPLDAREQAMWEAPGAPVDLGGGAPEAEDEDRLTPREQGDDVNAPILGSRQPEDAARPLDEGQSATGSAPLARKKSATFAPVVAGAGGNGDEGDAPVRTSRPSQRRGSLAGGARQGSGLNRNSSPAPGAADASAPAAAVTQSARLSGAVMAAAARSSAAPVGRPSASRSNSASSLKLSPGGRKKGGFGSKHRSMR